MTPAASETRREIYAFSPLLWIDSTIEAETRMLEIQSLFSLMLIMAMLAAARLMIVPRRACAPVKIGRPKR